MNNQKKGQITIINLIGLFITFILYFILVIPIFTPMIADTVTYLNTHSPNSFTPMTITLLYAIPFFFLLALILTAINYAIPQQEYRQSY
jgi:uncharacterized BrkB/YihY/UPF0761 family membrane protein